MKKIEISIRNFNVFLLISLFYIPSAFSHDNNQAMTVLSEKDINHLHYEKKIHLEQFDKNPMQQYLVWREQMMVDKTPYPQAAVLSTIKADGMPASRTIGIKDVTNNGFIFMTNSESNKAKEIQHNPHGSLLIIWHDSVKKMSFQVRVEGFIHPYKTPLKRYTLQYKDKHIPVKWQTFILEPTFVQFSHLSMVGGTGVIEYVDYKPSQTEWMRAIRDSYYAPNGC